MDLAFERNFLLCPFGSVESFAKSGQMDRALKRWRTLLDLAGPLLLFSEGFDPASNRPLGNYLQALTHSASSERRSPSDSSGPRTRAIGSPPRSAPSVQPTGIGK